jgi:alpha-tubulin suppressor-like RCC1 family protein
MAHRAPLAFLALTALGAGCFKPTYPEGLACSEGNTCPPGQTCDLATNVCMSEVGGGDGGGDGGGLADGGSDGPPPTRWAAMSVGGQHVCAIRDSDRLLHCWGSNGLGQLGDGSAEHRATPTPVSGGGRWLAVAAGAQHTCAIRETGELVCFGDNGDGQLGDGTSVARNVPTAVASTVGGWKAVFAGGAHSCAIDGLDGLWCWGANTSLQVGDGSGVATRSSPVAIAPAATWRTLALGQEHSCGIRTDASLWCWGSGGNGRLGVGDVSARGVPTQVAGTWSAVAAGYFHTCAVTPADTLSCWGYDGGLVGAGEQVLPRAIDGAWHGLGAGRFHTCVLTAEGAMSCFGFNDAGELGDGSLDARTAPTPVTGAPADWEEVDGGHNLTCARGKDGRIWCWGRNDAGQLGAIGPGSKNAPGPALPGTFSALADGYSTHGCAIRSDGQGSCWGPNYGGLLGVDGPIVVQTPQPLRGAMTFQLIAAGHGTTCGVSGGRLYCWGSNVQSWLGDGTTTDRDTPTAIGIATDWSWASSANAGTCGLHGGAAYCWGYGGGGRLGDGTGADHTQPTAVTGSLGTTWKQIELGALHACGIAEPTAGMRQLHCWGLNVYGQIGDSTTVSKTAPVRVGGDSDWLSVTVGDAHSCGLRAGGKAYCWGLGDAGQLGDGLTVNRSAPTPVQPEDVSWSTLDAGDGFTCGIRAGGTMWCWGSNASGKLGLGSWSTVQVSDAQQVGSDTDWTAVRAWGADACGLKSDGTVRCWGANYGGQLGDDSAFRWQPVPVVGP